MQELVLTPPLPRPQIFALGEDEATGAAVPRLVAALPGEALRLAPRAGRCHLRGGGAPDGDVADALRLEEGLGDDWLGHLGEVDGDLAERHALQDPLRRISVEVMAILAAAPPGPPTSVMGVVGVAPVRHATVLALGTLEHFCSPFLGLMKQGPLSYSIRAIMSIPLNRFYDSLEPSGYLAALIHGVEVDNIRTDAHKGYFGVHLWLTGGVLKMFAVAPVVQPV